MADVRGRKSRARQVHQVATPETIRKLDNVTIDRLYANGFLKAEHVDAWLEIHDAWKALSRGLGMRLMRFGERTDPGRGEISTRLEKLIAKYSAWHSIVAKEQHEVVIYSIEGHALRDIGPIERSKQRLRDGLHEYCKMDGTV